MTGVPALRVETASSAGAAALHAAFHAIASGYYRHVLVLGGEKMTHLSTSATTRILAGVIDKEERRCGATMAALLALLVLFILYPVVRVLWVSLSDEEGKLTLLHFANFFRRPLFREALWNSLLSGVLVVLFGSLMAVPDWV